MKITRITIDFVNGKAVAAFTVKVRPSVVQFVFPEIPECVKKVELAAEDLKEAFESFTPYRTQS